MPTYHEALNYIYSFTNFEVTPAGKYSSKTFDLSRMERLLALLGNPEKKFQSVHIAGTKGKGSTAAMIENALRSAEHLTGFYTSPHLHTFRERIRVAGEMIPPADVVQGIEKIKPLAEQIPGLTSFEIMTGLGFDYFVARGVEIAVVEVGLGGRLDATNVITPRVSVITSISYDHTAILGNTLTQIASEKAGIIKPNIPVVVAPQQDEALNVIRQVAHEKNAPLIQVDQDLRLAIGDARFKIVPKAWTLDLQTFDWICTAPNSQLSMVNYQLPLLGQHQLRNAAAALAAIQILRAQEIEIPDEAISQGIATVQWHGRFEILARHPFVIIDGAHNADSAHQLLATLREFFPRARLHFVFGAFADKDLAGEFAEILPHAASLILTRSHHPRAADPAQLLQFATPYHVATSITPNVATALREAQNRAEPDDVICVTGSLATVAEAKATWSSEQGIQIETDE